MRSHQLNKKVNKSSNLLFSIGLIAGLLLLVLVTQGVKGDTPPDLPPLTGPTPVDLVTLATNIAAGDEAEQRDEQAQQNARLTALAGTPVDKSNFVPPTSPPFPSPEPLPIGISQHPQAAGLNMMYSIRNAWTGLIGGNYLTVYAGSKAYNPGGGVWDVGIREQGMVKIQAVSSNGYGERVDSLGGDYLTPYMCGPVQVVAEEIGDDGQTRLLLVSTSRPSWFRFNLTSRSWDNFGVVVSGGGPDRYIRVTPPCAVLTPVPPVAPPPPPEPTEVPTLPIPTPN